MATNTYVALDTKTVVSPVSSVTFSSIPSGYTDLVLVCSVIGTSGVAGNVYARFNGDTGTNYSKTSLYGGGSGSGSVSRDLNASAIYAFAITPSNTTEPAIGIINIQNYSNTLTNKTVIGRNSTSGYVVTAFTGLWRSSAAISSITMTIDNGNMAVGSTFTIYGIKADDGTYSAKATGGTITADQFWVYHTFTSSGTFTPNTTISPDILVVGGGGGSGYAHAGGGGAGGVLAWASQQLSPTAYTVTIGAGGVGRTSDGANGTNGGNSQFGSLTASVGGGGGGTYGRAGSAGGSGGGAGAVGGSGGTATSGQGNVGGNTSTSGGAGGGGAGSAGSNTSTDKGSNGGSAISTVTNWGLLAPALTATGIGVSGAIAGGGGGGNSAGQATAGLGGGGGATDGGKDNTNPSNAVANTGSGAGGGGGDSSTYFGANGGSGVVIIRYPK